MKRHAIGIAAALVLIGPSGIASAQTDTSSANYVMNGCRGFLSRDGRIDRLVQGLCLGRIQTIGEFGDFFQVCMPDEAILGQAIRVVVAYIEQRSARMHEKFGLLAVEALQKAWPCR
jgi:hypothetical protein